MVFWTVLDLFTLILNRAGGQGLTALHLAQQCRNCFDIRLRLGAVTVASTWSQEPQLQSGRYSTPSAGRRVQWSLVTTPTKVHPMLIGPALPGTRLHFLHVGVVLEIIYHMVFWGHWSSCGLMGKKGTKLHFKSPMAERRHVLCVGVGGDRTHAVLPGGAGYARLAN